MATAIQIPDRPSFIQRAAQTMALADAVKTRRQDKEVEDLYRRTDDPEQIKAGLRSAGATDAYLKFTQHLSSLELDQLQMAKERNLALKSKFDVLSQVAHGLDTSDPAVRDQLWISTARPSLIAQGIPEEMLPENWQELSIYRDAKRDAEMAEKAIENEEKRREAERQAAEHIVAQEKAAMEKVKFRQERQGIDPGFESYFRNELAAQNIQPGQLNPQSEAQARKKALEDYKRLGDAQPKQTFQELTYDDFTKDPSLTAKYGATRIGFEKWQSDLIKSRAANAGIEGELTPRQIGVAIQLTNSLKGHAAYTDMQDIATGMSGVKSGLAQKNGFGDIAAINAVQRMIDPGATVREGDIGLIQSASSILAKITTDYPIERLREGDLLPEPTRQQILKMATDLYKVRAKNYNDIVGSQYKRLAEAAKVPFEIIGSDFAVDDETPTGNAIDDEILRALEGL